MSKDEILKEKLKSALNSLTDLFSEYFYYDRKEDEDLSNEILQQLISEGILTKEIMLNKISEVLDNYFDEDEEDEELKETNQE